MIDMSIISSIEDNMLNNYSIGNYYNRIINYKKANKNLNKIYKYQCLIPEKKNNNIIHYSINKHQLILIKKIGRKSRYGIIYLTINNNNNFKFAIKLTPSDFYNDNEIKISEFLSNIALKDINPHFLLIYKSLICNNKNNELYTYLPKLIRTPTYNISINELVSGTLKDLLLSKIANHDLLLNAIQQILISILSFHHFTNGMYHNDCHYKNFLFQRINPGGYFHYKIFDQDIYIKNYGFIWMIWDFGLVKAEPQNKNKRLEDYMKITAILYNELDFFKYYNLRSLLMHILKYINNYIEIFGNSDKNFFEELFKINGLYDMVIPKGTTIINNKTYIIK